MAYICPVPKLKAILSVFTLFAYFLSLGHSLIPHHHHNAETPHHHHHSDEHADEHDTHDHDHVAHENHFDDGIIDYLACVLGEHEHQDSNCDLVKENREQKQNENQDNAVKSVLELPVSGIFIADEYTSYSDYSKRLKALLISNEHITRAPPVS